MKPCSIAPRRAVIGKGKTRRGLSWLEDGSCLASGANDNLVAVWDVRALSQAATARPMHRLARHTAAVKALAWCPWRRGLPPCTVMQQGSQAHVNVHVPAGSPASVHIRLEEGGRWEAWQVDNHEPDREIDGAWVGEATFALPAELPLGYHRLVLETPGSTVEETLVVTPRFLGFPEAMGNRRVWGYATQLYSVRSANSPSTKRRRETPEPPPSPHGAPSSARSPRGLTNRPRPSPAFPLIEGR